MEEKLRAGQARLRKWEIALFLSLGITLLWGLTLGEVRCCAWWGTVYPELLSFGKAQTELPGGEGVVLRLRLLEWLRGLLHGGM